MALLLACLTCLACDSTSNEEPKRPPTAMQLIQGKWDFTMAETLLINSDLAEEAQAVPGTNEKLGRLENEYSLTLTPLALHAKEGEAIREYVIKSVSDDGQILVLAIQPKDTQNKEEWINYTFTITGEHIHVDMPDKGLLAFKRGR